MKIRKFTLPEISKAVLAVHHMDTELAVLMNQNESHIHKECEIYLNLSGDISFEVENHIYPIARGSVIVTRPYEYHHCICHTAALHEHYWLTFSAEESADFLQIFFSRRKGKNNLILLDEEQLQECCGLLEELLSDRQDVLSRRIAFLQLLRLLGEGKREHSIGETGKMPPDVMRALNYMEEHLTEETDVGAIARAASVSINTLEKHFKDSLSLSPIAVLRKKRLIASMEHLRNGNSITEAALQSGFSDHSNYIQLFRKQFGITPLQYKKKIEK